MNSARVTTPSWLMSCSGVGVGVGVGVDGKGCTEHNVDVEMQMDINHAPTVYLLLTSLLTNLLPTIPERMR